MCVYMHACVCVYVHLEPEANTRYSPILISTLLSEAGFLTESGVLIDCHAPMLRK